MATLTAHQFVLRSLESDREVAHAVVCVERTYACVLWVDTNRLERRPGSRNLWNSFEHELPGLTPGPLPQLCAASVLLTGSRLIAVLPDYLGPATIDAQTNPLLALDRCLSAIARVGQEE